MVTEHALDIEWQKYCDGWRNLYRTSRRRCRPLIANKISQMPRNFGSYMLRAEWFGLQFLTSQSWGSLLLFGWLSSCARVLASLSKIRWRCVSAHVRHTDLGITYVTLHEFRQSWRDVCRWLPEKKNFYSLVSYKYDTPAPNHFPLFHDLACYWSENNLIMIGWIMHLGVRVVMLYKWAATRHHFILPPN